MKQIDNASVLLRIATTEDIRQIVQLQFDSIRTLCAKDYSKRELEALLEDKSQGRPWSNEIIFVAELAGKIVGFAGLSKWKYLVKYGTISAVFVHPAYVRLGIGSLLLEQIEIEAVKNGIRILRVASSLTGYSFYQSRGYQHIDRLFHNTPLTQKTPKTAIKLASGVNFPCVSMEKVLLPETTREVIVTFIYQFFVIMVVLILLISLF